MIPRFPARQTLWLAVMMPALILFLLTTAEAHQPKRKPFTRAELAPVLAALEQEGFARKDLSRLLFDPRLRRVERVVGLNAINRESEARYRQFLTPYALGLARRFLRRRRVALHAVEHRYRVPARAITAILLVETQFGRARLRYRVLEVFLTLAVESGPAAVARHYARLKPRYPDLTRAHLEARMAEKRDWAYQELAALVSMAVNYGKKLYPIRSSYAGAFGIPQFLPSSFHRWAVDGNGDQRIDLDDMDDALASIAVFLNEHGWKEPVSQEQRRQAVWEYNHSRPYVNTILAITRALKKPTGTRKQKS